MTRLPIRQLSSRSTRARRVALALILLAGLFAGIAHSQQEVAVSDRTVGSNTDDIKRNTSDIKRDTGDIKSNTDDISKRIGGNTGGSDTVNGHLKYIDTLGSAPSSALSTVAKPDVDLDTNSSQSTSTSSCNGRAAAQQQNCKNIILTKSARFTYMKSMYDMALKRQKTLDDLQAARRNLGTEDFGKLQDNSNQILTLIAQIQIDRQQMESVNNAYAARLEYLQNQQAQLAKSATEPGGDSIVSNIASQAIAGVVLQTALNVQSSGDTQPLSIEKSNGW